MFKIHNLIKSIQYDKAPTNSKVLFGEHKRHEVGAEGVLIDSLHDNMLCILSEKMKATGSELYKSDNEIDHACERMDYELNIFEESCKVLATASNKAEVRLYAEAKKNISLKAILKRIVEFFKGIPKMIMRILGRFAVMYRKLKVRSNYLINRTEFFQTFNDSMIKSNRGVKLDMSELRDKYQPWLDKNLDKLKKIKLSGNSEKDYKNILNYIVGYLPVMAYGLNKETQTSINDKAIREVFGNGVVDIVSELASHAATMDDNTIYMDATTINTINGLDASLDRFPFLDVSSHTTSNAFEGTPLAGVHNMVLSKHHIYISQIAKSLGEGVFNASLDAVHFSKVEDEDEFDANRRKNAIDKMSKSVDSALKGAEHLKSTLTNTTNKGKGVSIVSVFKNAIMMQQLIYAIVLGDAEGGIDNAMKGNIGDVKSWGEIQKLIEKTGGKTLGYGDNLNFLKRYEVKSLMNIFEKYASEYKPEVRNSILDHLLRALNRGTYNAEKAYDESIRAEELLVDFIAGYVDNDNYVQSAINEYVSRSNILYNASASMTKVTTILIEIIFAINNYRKVLITDLAYRMQTVTDMFVLADMVLEMVKVKEEPVDRTVRGHLAFNS